ncbi:PRC-barrel domain-containing protein [Parasulfitobacter algicola]|uniref:PRC-barrel domain-containing protein n=1 Tax=Parasulfitobacter algicola TaxID=2614809 RepID=A0ABX2IT43_9RHOB|nr:PRC-barrel domain-containing protein [Sulfitobacter algicola]NSX53977.1 PRC-barrel domain-containing protein [Sulfitobacter algicola]
MRTFLATTAVICVTLPALAETTTYDSQATTSENVGVFFFEPQNFGADTLSASTLIGKYVYTTELKEFASNGSIDVEKEWNNIGEVRDVVMSADGKTRSVILDIGGFLGMGEHTVAVNMDQLKLVNDRDDAGDFFVVVQSTKDKLMNAPAFDMSEIGAWAAEDQS